MSKLPGLFILLLTVWSASSFAFVENVTHGYPNCLACHVSPSGGGVLNDYGRSLSKELMSTWSWEGSERPAFGAFRNTQDVKWGGDVRLLQTYLDNSRVKQGKLFLMQQNLEAAVRFGKSWFVGTVGTREGPKGTQNKGEFLSERHYIFWETSEDSRVRVGKFRREFGLYDPNHTRVTKAPLGFGPNSETYNLEFSKSTDEWELFLGSSLGRLDQAYDPNSERSLSLTYSKYIETNGKVGFSLLTGESSLMRRNLAGVFAALPIGERGIFKIETDYQRSALAADSHHTRELFATALSVGRLFVKGLTAYVSVEYLHSDLADGKSLQYSPGLGIQWLPIPHVELQAEFKRQTVQSDPQNPSNSAWVLLHLYL